MSICPLVVITFLLFFSQDFSQIMLGKQIFVRVDCGLEKLVFSDLRNDLVPAVCFFDDSAACEVVDESKIYPMSNTNVAGIVPAAAAAAQKVPNRLVVFRCCICVRFSRVLLMFPSCVFLFAI